MNQHAVAVLIVFLFAGLLGPASAVFAGPPNLVPERPAKRSPHYWCTWYAQNYWVQRGGEIADLSKLTNPAARETLNHRTLFNNADGWAHYLPRGRGDFTFLIDHGWQVKKGDGDMQGGAAFFNLIVDPKDFPPYANVPPQEALLKFNRELQALGWRGLGLWVRGSLPAERAERYVEWSKYAGIPYWKIDGGDTRAYATTKAKQKLCPALILEHAVPPGHFNGPASKPDAEDYPSSFAAGGKTAKAALDILQNTDVMRTYDVAPHLITPTTLRRVHDLLMQTAGHPKYRAMLNTQDLPYVSMGLGTALGSKRHPNYMERTYKGRDLHHQLEDHRRMQSRMNAVERLGRWSRIALPIPAGTGTYAASKEMLTDYFPHDRWSTWNKGTWGKTMYQNAPAVMARNMPLPTVEIDGEAPYVLASTYPNGATAVAVEGRCRPDKPYFVPRAKIAVTVADATRPVGIAGRYGELVLKFAGDVEGVRHVWAQDLLAAEATDIKRRVKIAGRCITIPGKLIDEIGTAAGDKGDISAPGMVLRLEGESLPGSTGKP